MELNEDEKLPEPIQLQDGSIPLDALHAGTAPNDVLLWTGTDWISAPSGAPVNAVSGPGSATLTALARWNNTNGRVLSNSTVTLSDTGFFNQIKSSSDISATTNYKIGTDVVLTTDNILANLSLGIDCGSSTGGGNTSIGQNSLNSITDGSNNSVLGYNAASSLTTGDGNLILGQNAANDLTTGGANVILGTGASAGDAAASNRVVIGSGASGQYDNAVHIAGGITKFWFSTLESTTPLDKVLYFDTITGLIKQGTLTPFPTSFLDSEFRILSVDDQTAKLAFDCQYIASSTTRTVIALDNPMIMPGLINTSIALGNTSYSSSLTRSTLIGVTAGQNLTTGTDNAFLGYAAGYSNVTGNYLTAIGAYAAYSTTVSNITAVGYQSAYSNNTGLYNTSIGGLSLYSNTSGSYNTSVGYQSASSSLTNNYITSMGYQALKVNITSSSSAFGYQALYSNTTGQQNSAFGYQAMKNNITGSYSTAFGYNAATSSLANGIAAFGSNALELCTGADNSAFGRDALITLTSGINNTSVGSHSGINLATGSNNIFIGYNATPFSDSTSGSIVIGVNATGKRALPTTNGDNVLTITMSTSNAGAYCNAFRQATGSYVLNYNNVTNEITYAAGGGGGGNTFLDDVFRVQNVADPTKQFALDCVNITTETTRTWTVPNFDGILPGLDANGNIILGLTQISDMTLRLTLIGYLAGENVLSATDSVFVGYQAGQNVTTASNNVLIGATNSTALTTGGDNVVIGYNVATVATTSNSVLIGSQVDNEGDNNIIIGKSNSSIYNNSIVIGSDVSPSADDQIIIGSTTATSLRVFGAYGQTTANPYQIAVVDNANFISTISTIPLSLGGTNNNITASAGALVYSNASQLALTAVGVSGQILVSNGTAAPSWTTAKYPVTVGAVGTILRSNGTDWVATTSTFADTYDVNTILYASSANTVTGLATANNSVLITSVSGVPSLSQTLPSAVQLNITQLSTISTGVWQGTAIGLTYGGTGGSLTASDGGIVYSDATRLRILSATANANKMLLSGASTTPSWSTSTIPTSSGVSGKILISDGTNYVLSTPTYPTAASTAGKLIRSDGSNLVMSTSTFADTYTNNALLYGNGANNVASLAVGSSGQVLVSSGPSSAPAWTTLSSIGVISVAGTTNQILVNGATTAASGAVTVSLPSAVTIATSVTISALTQGSILFAGPSGLISQDNTNLFWNDTTNRLGIGTIFPDSTLNVSGVLNSSANFPYNANLIDSAASAANVGGGIGFAGNDGTTTSVFGVIQGGKENATSGNYAGYLRFFTRVNGNAFVTEQMRITSAGFVGIGITPTSRLHVSGSIAGATNTIVAQSGINFSTTIAPTGSGTITDSAAVYILPTFIKGTIATWTNAYGEYIDTYTVAATNTYGLYVKQPSGGVATALYADNMLIGTATPLTVNTSGTITQGVWQGTVVGLTYGGTAANLTASNGGIVWSNASQLQILAGTATANKMLLSGATATPSWSTSTIPSSAGATANKVLLSDGTNYVLSSVTFPNASATSGKIIISDGTNWTASNATYPTSTTINQILYSSAANTVSGITTANNGVMITSASGVPSFLANGTTGQVLVATTGSPPSWGSIAAGVSSIIGTASQVLANATFGSAQTGAVTLTLPAAIITPGTLAVNGLTTGSILFSGASSVISQANSSLFWDNTNLFLGIGTATPAGIINTGGSYAIASGNGYSLIDSHAYLLSNGAAISTLNGVYVNFSTSVLPSATVALNTMAGAYISPTITTNASSSSNISTVYGVYANAFSSSINATSTISVSNSYAIYALCASGQVTGLTVINSYTGYFVAPNNGVRRVALYMDTICYGYASQATAASTLSLSNTSTTIQRFTGSTASQVVRLPSTTTIYLGQQYTLYNDSTQSIAVQTSGGSALTTLLAGTKISFTVVNQSTDAAASWYIDYYAVKSVVGTANQIDVTTSTTGVSTLTLSSTIVTPGTLAVNGALSTGATATVNTTTAAGLSILGTQTATATLVNSGNQAGVFINTTMQPASGGAMVAGMRLTPSFISPSAQTISATACIYITPTYASNVATITTAYGLLLDAGTAQAAGSIPTAYGLFVNVPNYGTSVKAAAYLENLAVGTYTGITPPSNGAIISGKLGVGTSSVDANAYVHFSSSAAIGLVMDGTVTAVDGGPNQWGIRYVSTFNPTTGSAYSFAISLSPTFNIPTTRTTTQAGGLRIFNSISVSHAGTISNAYGLWVESGSTNTGTITNTWGAFISTPTYGSSTTNYGLQINGSDTAGATNGTRIALYLAGTITGDDTTSTVSIRNAITLRPTTTSRNTYGIYNDPICNVQSTNVVNNFYASYNLAQGSAGSGTLTNAYSGYFANPTVGTNQIALYTDDLAIGYTATVPPTNGAIISGNVGMGTSSPGAPLEVYRATAGVQELIRVTNFNTGTTSTADLNFRLGTSGTTTTFISNLWNGAQMCMGMGAGSPASELVRILGSSRFFGVGTIFPQNTFNATGVQYSAGTATQSGTTVTGTGTTFTSAMVGSIFVFTTAGNNLSSGVITGFTNSNTITVTTTNNVPTPTTYAIYYAGLNVTSTGLVGVATTSPTQALEIGGTNAQIYLNSATSNMLYFNANGTAAPTFTTARSVGTKIVLFPAFVNGSSADYAIGIESNLMWFGVPITANGFNWYGGTTQWMRLNNQGLGIGIIPTSRLHVTGTIASATNTVTAQTGVNLAPAVNPTGAVTTVVGTWLNPTFSVAGGTIVNAYGMFIDTFSVASSGINYGLAVTAPSSGTTANYAALFNSATDASVLISTGAVNREARLRLWATQDGAPGSNSSALIQFANKNASADFPDNCWYMGLDGNRGSTFSPAFKIGFGGSGTGWASFGTTDLFYYSTAGSFGIGNIPLNTLSTMPTQYSAGTASQTATTVTGVGTAFTSAMVGSQITYVDGTYGGTILTAPTGTSLTTSVSATASGLAYKINYPGLQVTTAGLVGVGTIYPLNTFSVSPFQYGAGGSTITQAGSTTVTGSGTTFTSAMVGSQIVYNDGTVDTITGFTSATIITVSTSRTKGPLPFYVQYAGLQVTSTGVVNIGTNQSTYPFAVYAPTSVQPFSLSSGGSSCSMMVGYSGATNLEIKYGGAQLQYLIGSTRMGDIYVGSNGGVFDLRNSSNAITINFDCNGPSYIGTALSVGYTTAPTSALNVSGSQTYVAQFDNSTLGPSVNAAIAFQEARAIVGYYNVSPYSGSTALVLAGAGSGKYVDIVSGDRDIIFNTNATERMRILSTGLIGMGINAPTSRLHVVGSLAASTNTIVAQSGINFSPTVAPTGSGTITDAAAFYTLPTFTRGSIATWTNSYGHYISTYSLNAVTNYGLFVAAPTSGTRSNIAGYFGGDLQVTGIESSSKKTDPIDAATVMYFPFSEGTGTRVTDTSVNRETGVFGGSGTTWVNGIEGYAPQFNGSGYITVTVSPSIAVTDVYSITCWIYPTTIGVRQTIYSSNSDGGGFQLEISAGNLVQVTIPGVFVVIEQTASITAANTWYNITYTSSASTAGSHFLYVNGALRTLVTDVTQTVATTLTSALIGARAATPTQPFFGIIDELQLWSRTLTAREVVNIYNGSGISAFTSGSVIFAGTSGQLAQDNSNFFWDDTNNRLGIKTPTPSQPIHLVGSSTDQALLQNTTASTASGFQGSPSLILSGTIWNSSSGSQIMRGGLQMGSISATTNPSISKLSFLVGTDGASATEAMFLSSNRILFMLGGADFTGTSLSTNNSVWVTNTAAATIGAAQSSNTLGVRGRAWNSSNGDTITQGYMQMINITNNANPTVDRLAFFVASANAAATERMCITTQGRLGINTTNPSYTVEAVGTAGTHILVASDGTSRGSIYVSNGANSQIQIGSITIGNQLGFYVNGGTPSVVLTTNNVFGIGTEFPGTVSRCTISSTNAYNTLITGTQTLQTGNNQIALYCNSTLNPALAVTGYIAGLSLEHAIASTAATTVANAFGAFIAPSFTTNAGIITTAIGLRISSSGTGGPGTISNATGLLVATPAYGSAAATVYGVQINGSDNAAATNGAHRLLFLSGTIVGNDGTRSAAIFNSPTINPTTTSRDAYGYYSIPIISATASQTINNAACIYIVPSLGSNAGTITNAYGMHIDNGSTPGSVVTNTWAALIRTPLYGSTSTGNIGVQIIGSDNPAAPNGSKYALILSGRITGDDGSKTVTINNTTFLQPTTTLRDTYGYYGNSTIIAASGQTISNAVGMYIYNNTNSNVGTITALYGMYIANGTTSTGLSVPNATSLRVETPSGGTAAATVYGIQLSGSDTAGINYGTRRMLFLSGTITGDDGTFASGVHIQNTFQPTNNNMQAMGLYLRPVVNTQSTNTITAAHGAYMDLTGSVASGGTITSSYTCRIIAPSIGTTRVGLSVEGNNGTPTPTRYLFQTGGTITGDSTNCVAIYNVTTLNPTTNGISGYGIRNLSDFTISTGNTASHFALYSQARTNTATGGTITAAYSGYFDTPGANATSRIALYADSFFVGYATTAAAGGTTTLSNADKTNQYFTGTTQNQTVLLPSTATLLVGTTYIISNRTSSGVLTIQTSAAAGITTISAGSTATFTCLNASNVAASWDILFDGGNSAILTANSFIRTTETITAAGALSTTLDSIIDAANAPFTVTLGDGATDQVKLIRFLTLRAGGTVTVTCTIGTFQMNLYESMRELRFNGQSGYWQITDARSLYSPFLNSFYITKQLGTKLLGTGFTGSSEQGYAVALSADGLTLATGGRQDNSNTGATWIFTRVGTTFTQQGTKLVGTGGTGSPQQGTGCALSADGNTLAIGGSGDNTSIGATWIFTRSGTTWTQQGSKLVGTGNTGNSGQGCSCSLSADGNTLAMGGFIDGTNTGAIWIFTRSGTTWTQQGTKLVGTGATGSSVQGISCSLSADGNTVASGGSSDNSGIGATWIFTRSGTTWTQQGTKLVGTGFTGSAFQGNSVSLSADGNTLAVGGLENSGIGATWVFTRSGTTWTQQGTKLVGTGGTGSPGQGRSCQLSADGNTLITTGANDNTAIGAIWVFTRSGTTWTQQGSKILGTGNTGTSFLGYSCALSADGNILAAGARLDNLSTGATWIFV